MKLHNEYEKLWDDCQDLEDTVADQDKIIDQLRREAQ